MLTLNEIRMVLMAIYPLCKMDKKYIAIQKKMKAMLKRRKITVRL